MTLVRHERRATAVRPGNNEFELFIAGTLPTEILDGTHFSQAALEVPQSLSNGFLRHTVQNLSGVVTTLQGDFTGQVSVVP